MSENNKEKKTLSLGKKEGLKPLSLGQNTVRQNIAQGRSKTVEVRVKRKKIDLTAKKTVQKVAPKQNDGEQQEQDSLSNLTKGEMGARMKALQDALKQEEERLKEREEKRLKEEQLKAEEVKAKLEAAAKEQAENAAKKEAEQQSAEKPKEAKKKPVVMEAKKVEERKVKPVVFKAASAYEKKDKKSLSLRNANRARPKRLSDALNEEKPKQQEAKPARKPRTERTERPASTSDKAPVVVADDMGLEKGQNKKTKVKKAKDGVRGPSSAEEQRQEKRAKLKVKGQSGKKLSRTNITRALDDEEMGRSRSLAAVKRAREKQMKQGHQAFDANAKVVREVIISESLTVGELASRMAVRSADVVKELMKMGMMVTVNQTIDGDTAQLICEEFGHTPKRVSDTDFEKEIMIDDSNDENQLPRAPVVTIMGHVDHGKTSLLDSLRQTDVAGGEAGGITQHIGAYQITLENGGKITFIDTPGHAAFSEMRSRGANITDIVILVVAADDGIKEQTLEAINHAKAAEVPMIVAINKIDKPEADSARVKNELLQHNVILEEFGGEIMAVEVSAKQKTGLDKLEEGILLQAEMLDLKANPNRKSFGTIVESKIEKGRGAVATVLVQKGTLNVGDVFVAGTEYGKVRAILDDKGKQIKQAGPALPVAVLGFNGVPNAGDDFIVVDTDSQAREVAEKRSIKKKEAEAAKKAKSMMETMMSKISEGDVKELSVVIKADVQGSLEALTASLMKLSNEEVKVQVLHGAVGGINESDITLAKASEGFVIGFNVRANAQAREMARRDGVDIRYYSIIYDVIDDAKVLLGGLMAPDLREKFLGYATIRQVFSVSKVGKIAGCYVTSGLVKRGAKVRLLRDDVVIHEGTLKTLRRFKDEVKEVKDNFECGMAFESYNDIKENDVIECFEMEEVRRTLD